ncbi:hypothetical protein [Brevundimonas sp.]|uniref:hypothetical protein n=1 Tax=Brevundimonas sp. TaxID=1871086 RepID=UPI0028AF0897|nr:hypothetical protein [Brevundimonas sp.]
MKTGALIIAVAIAFFNAAPALTCTPAIDYIENRQLYEDRQLNEATVLFRGVIENTEFKNGVATMTIRSTRTFWGTRTPPRIIIEAEYYHLCARGNLHFAVQETVSPLTPPPGVPKPDMPIVRNGLGVTILGRPEDAASPWDLTILVDHAPDTQRVLHRFQELKRAQ